MVEYILILTLWTGETEYQNLYTKGFCEAIQQSWITHESTQIHYGPPKHMNIYCEPLYPGEPIIEYWKICSYREGCWGPDVVNWTSIPPTKPGWYLHRHRVKTLEGPFEMADLYEVRKVNGILSIYGMGYVWRPYFLHYPIASMGGEWTQDALVFRGDE